MDLTKMLDDFRNYDGIIIDGVTELVDNNVPSYSSNLWAEAPYIEEYIDEILQSDKKYETILDVISLACEKYLIAFLYNYIPSIAKEHGWDGESRINVKKGWNQWTKQL